jgi:hypothetical protein
MNPKNSMRIFTATFFALTLTHCSVLITYDRNDNPQTDGGDFPDIISPVTEVGVTGMCLPMFTRCGDLCVDTRTSNNHCGTCGSACRPLQACVSGVCRCPVGSVANAEGNCVSIARAGDVFVEWDGRRQVVAALTLEAMQAIAEGLARCAQTWA